MSDKIVPLISSGTKGPLGVLHLPRLWQKVSLEAAGKIADGYPGIGAGYDSMVIDGLGLNLHNNRIGISGFPQWYPFGLGERYQKKDETMQFRFVIEERG